MFDNEIWHKVAKLKAFKKANQPICCLELQEMVKKKKVDRIFIFSDFNIFILEKGIFNSALSIKTEIKFLEIVNLTLIDEESFSITIDGAKTFTFISDISKFIYKRIAQQAITMLLPSELPELKDEKQLCGKIEPLPNGFFLRFGLFTQKPNPQPPSTFMNELTGALDNPTKPGELDLTRLVDVAPFVKQLLSCLDIQPTITSIILPKCGHNQTFWPQLAECLKTNKTLETIITEETIDESFKKIINAIRSNPDTKLKSILFLESNSITPEFSDIIASLFDVCSLETIGFYGGLQANVFDKIIGTAILYPKFKNLKRLELESITKGKPCASISKIKWLEQLRILECNIDLTDLLQMVSSLTNLHILRAKNIKHSNDDVSSIVLPQTLDSISITDSVVDGPVLASLMKLLFMHKPTTGKTELILTSIESDYSHLFNSLKTLAPTTTLYSLTWKKNKVHPLFFQYLNKAKNLQTLSIAESLNADSINACSQFILQRTSLKEVYLDGGKSAEPLGDALIPLIRTITGCNHLEKISMNSQDLSNSALPEISKFLVETKRLKAASFDSRYDDPKMIRSFYDAVMKRGPPLDMPLFTRALKKLKKSGKIKVDDYNYLQDCNKVIKTGITSGYEDKSQDDEEYDEKLMDESSEQFPEDHRQMPTGASSNQSQQASVTNQNAAINDDDDDGIDWSLNLIPITPPDDTQVFRDIAETYSFERVYNAFRSV